jgi:hypothetical protein
MNIQTLVLKQDFTPQVQLQAVTAAYGKLGTVKILERAAYIQILDFLFEEGAWPEGVLLEEGMPILIVLDSLLPKKNFDQNLGPGAVSNSEFRNRFKAAYFSSKPSTTFSNPANWIENCFFDWSHHSQSPWLSGKSALAELGFSEVLQHISVEVATALLNKDLEMGLACPETALSSIALSPTQIARLQVLKATTTQIQNRTSRKFQRNVARFQRKASDYVKGPKDPRPIAIVKFYWIRFVPKFKRFFWERFPHDSAVGKTFWILVTPARKVLSFVRSVKNRNHAV